MRAVRRSGGRAVGMLTAALLLTARPPVRLSAQTRDPNPILDRAVAAYANVRTIRANFTLVVKDPMIGDTTTSSGEFLEQRPGKYALRWSHPRGDAIVADGRNQWVYLPSSAPGQVVRSSLGHAASGEGVDIIGEFVDRPRERFTVAYERADQVAGRAADVLALTPKDRNAPYTRVLIWVDRADSLVRRIEVAEGSGTTRLFTLDRVRLNAAIAPSQFTFTPPRGARVVDASN